MINNKNKILNNRKKGRYTLFLLAIPFVIFIFAFGYVPLFGWIYSLYDYKPWLSLREMDFVGLRNFGKLITDWGDLSRVLRNTLIMSFLGIISSPLPMAFAILLNEIKLPFFKKFVQTTTTLPYFISWIIVFALSFALFSNEGLLPNLLSMFGYDKPYKSIFSNNKAVWIFQWLLGTWKSMGWSGIIYIASIAGIDADLYEAARVDGANRFHLIRYITIPGLIPTYFVLLLLSISSMLSNGFEQYFVFFNSLVADRIEVLDYYIYKVGILINDYSYSTVLGIAKTVISIALLFTANTLSKKLRGQSIV